VASDEGTLHVIDRTRPSTSGSNPPAALHRTRGNRQLRRSQSECLRREGRAVGKKRDGSIPWYKRWERWGQQIVAIGPFYSIFGCLFWISKSAAILASMIGICLELRLASRGCASRLGHACRRKERKRGHTRQSISVAGVLLETLFVSRN
jgi:hypothetical protein